MSEDLTRRASLLLESGRSEEALKLVSMALAEDPDDALAHCLRALALSDLGEHSKALESANRASGEDPEWAFPHYVVGQVLLAMDKPKRALSPALEAVALDPDDEDHFGLLSACYVGLSRWRDGLEAAEDGLALAPKDTQCANLRALCLRQLGEVDEATSALESSLGEDPENAWTHQNLGYAAVADGRYDDAIESFRESLRLDPTDDAARTGLATAIKGRVPLFRPIIAWQLFCSKLSSQLGIGLIIGLVVLHRVVQSQLGPDSSLGAALFAAYVSFVWMSWAGDSLFDVMLLFRREWRPILTTRERFASVGVVICILLGITAVLCRFTLGLPGMEWTAFAFAFAAIPVAAWADLPNAKARAVGATVAVAALVLALGGLMLQLYCLSLLEWNIDLQGPKAEMEALRARLRPKLELGTNMTMLAILIAVGSSWLMPVLGFIPEARGGRGQRRRPRSES